MMAKFSKMHGLGNDFVVMDSLTQHVHMTPAIVRRIADRHTGVGCDQLIMIGPPNDPHLDFNARYFNADGSEAEQCGNGARCVARYVYDRKLTGNRTLRVRTAKRVLELRINQNGSVTAEMGMPIFEPAEIPFDAPKRENVYTIVAGENDYEIAAVSMGNPHAVLQTDSTHCADVAGVGAQLEAHPRFANKVNVGFMQIENRQHIKLRVFERGVGETLACGTAACAAVVAGIQQELLGPSVCVSLPGGDLAVDWDGEGTSVSMTGPAVNVFNGYIKL